MQRQTWLLVVAVVVLGVACALVVRSCGRGRATTIDSPARGLASRLQEEIADVPRFNNVSFAFPAGPEVLVIMGEVPTAADVERLRRIVEELNDARVPVRLNVEPR